MATENLMINVVKSQWVTRLHSNGGKVDSFSHVCPECKYEYRDLNVNGESVCPNCGADMRERKAEVVRCKDCKHLNVLNRKEIYAHCPKTNTVFLPFELDTRTHFCSYGERKDNERKAD